MFTVKEPSTLNKPWRLSSKQDPIPTIIPIEITKQLQNYHIIGIEFLYNNYKNGLNGAILNQELDMNLPLQITAFLSGVFNEKGIVLVVCPDQLLNTWHYYLTNYGKFTTKIITIDNFGGIASVYQEKLVIFVKFSDLKLLESLVDLQYFCIIIDKFDELATKLVLNRLQSRYKIGITYNNFIGNSNQKIQWKLLNWSNPGCVGQLSKFSQIDNENSDKFRNNYHYWWLRLTWKYDECFKQPTLDEIDDLQQIVKNWAKLQLLPSDNDNQRKIRKTSRNKTKRKIIEKHVKLPSMDENPILTSIRRNFEQSSSHNDDDDNQPSTSKICSESENFLLNLIENHQNHTNYNNKHEDNLNKRIQQTLKVADDLLQDDI